MVWVMGVGSSVGFGGDDVGGVVMVRMGIMVMFFCWLFMVFVM